MKRNIRLVIEYDGTVYHGWQSQRKSGRPTIQDTLEDALKTLTKSDCKTVSSGRTDAGVHAFGHVASFKTMSTIPAGAWAPALNHLLPADIRILSSDEVSSDFHARFSALSKTYQYRILNRREPTALYRNYAWHIPMPLDLRKMKRAAGYLIGRHDFSSFRGSGCGAKTPVRTIHRLELKKNGEFIDAWIEADAFLQYMARNIMGTLAETGLGRFSPNEVREILLARDRTKSGKTAPPYGLYLAGVRYPDK